jgi:ribosomal protein S18 acetylase RimI-like enzyme
MRQTVTEFDRLARGRNLVQDPAKRKRFSGRLITGADDPFIWEMRYQAIYVAPGASPPPPEIVRQSELARYVMGWGKRWDLGLIAAEAGTQRSLGAAWVRLLAGDEHGYGYIDDETPELSIAVFPEFRGQDIGTRLLGLLLQLIRRHYPAVSLSVSPRNPAVRLYERHGFKVVSESENALVMCKIFDS